MSAYTRHCFTQEHGTLPHPSLLNCVTIIVAYRVSANQKKSAVSAQELKKDGRHRPHIYSPGGAHEQEKTNKCCRMKRNKIIYGKEVDEI
ncbi:hypothetical protein OUZ56_007207 [Daphnia magna]|uniref:Uncharacterized protein n=1 Tax=Daphnia magna TaxID=35525 RepID=A0ABQ9YXX0_9CRUS|nr:hypothetical protein OUZ56_007207 [Daphnia magna]